MFDQYKLYPYITKKRMFYETMEELLPSLKVIISDGGTQTLMPLDSFNSASGSVPQTENAAEEMQQEEE
jgi:membrane protease subunit HflK